MHEWKAVYEVGRLDVYLFTVGQQVKLSYKQMLIITNVKLGLLRIIMFRNMTSLRHVRRNGLENLALTGNYIVKEEKADGDRHILPNNKRGNQKKQNRIHLS